jgi:hypothetical protein
MAWINKFRSLGEAERANPWDETVINGAPYVPPHATGNSPEIPAVAFPQKAQVREQVKSDRRA